jgi:hypothetical protein
MITAPRTLSTAEPIDPYAAYDPYANGDPYADTSATGGTAAATPHSSAGWTPPPPTPTPTAYAPSPRMIAPDSGDPAAQPIDGGGWQPPPLPQQLPDGTGGAIPVPPDAAVPGGQIITETTDNLGGGKVPRSPNPIPGFPLPPDGVGDPPPPTPPEAPWMPPDPTAGGGGGGVGDAPPIGPPPDPYVPPPADTPPEAPVGPPPPSDPLPPEGSLPPTVITEPWMPPPPVADQNAGLPAAPPAAGPPAAAAPPATTQAPTEDFGAGNNLISSEITPQADPRLMQYQGATDQIMQRMLNGPNRYDLAKQYYDNFSNETEGDFDRSLKTATDLGAARGRLGSGILTNTYGDLTERRLRDKENAKRGFLTNALEGTIGDTRNAFNDIGAAERNIFGEGQSDRGEFRTERDYQRNLAEQAILRRIQQQVMEGSASQQDFENALTQYQQGQRNDPTSALQTAAGEAGNEATGAGNDVEALLRALLARSQQSAA